MDDFEGVARAAVSEAGALLRGAFSRSKHVQYKGPVDLVTETDREAEALVTGRLRDAFPNHLIVAEEASAVSGAHRPAPDVFTWYLDPLDGTVNFAHSVPHFAVSLALGRGDDMLLGIVHDPLRDETFVARRGRGATLNDAPIRVSETADLEHALLATGLPYDRRERTDFYLGFTADFIRQARDIRRFGSAALDLCYVACGRYDGFWEWRLHPWDTAAGSLIVREAGGMVTDFRGQGFDLFGEQTLASNGRVHAAMVEVLDGATPGVETRS
jgi:myo-inositol-1(or 4)-monophosphatase